MDLKNLNFLFTFLSALGLCSAQQILDPGPLKGMLAGNMTIATHNLPSPLPQFVTISWTFDNGNGQKPLINSVNGAVKPPNADFTGRVVLNGNTGSLQLTNLRVQDSGIYTVNMISDSGQLTGQTELKVFEPVADVVVTANVTNPVELNDTVSLSCSAVGSELSFKWRNGSSEIVPGGRVSLSNDNRTLIISSILRFDSGPLICVVRNIFMTRSANLTLSISYGPENVAVTSEKVLYTSGSNLNLSCSAQSNPPVIFQWYLNGIQCSSGSPVLQKTDIKPDMSGNYTCLAFNSKTLRYKASSPIQITILDALTGARITGPTTPLIAGNSSANLTCQASIGSIDTRIWSKDGHTLSPSNMLTFSADRSSVFITTVQRSDSGLYQCIIQNSVSSNNAMYRLTVNYGPENVKVEGEKAVEVDSRVELKCSADSEPTATFRWAFNGTAKVAGTPTYIIENAVYSNAGKYSCEATNNVTGKSSTAFHMLAVKEHGALPEGLSGGAIAGIVIGVLIGLLLIVVIAKKVMKKRNFDQLDMCAGPSKTNERIESPY